MQRIHISLDVHVHFRILHVQVEALIQEKHIEGTLHVLEELVEVTDHLETPTFPRDLDTAIDVVNQTLNQLVVDQDVNINNVSCHMVMHGTVLYVSFTNVMVFFADCDYI